MNIYSLNFKIYSLAILFLLVPMVGCLSTDVVSNDQNSDVSSEKYLTEQISDVIAKFEDVVPNKKNTVKIGTITYGNSDQPTNFSAYIKSALSQEINSSKKFVEVAGEELMKNNPLLFGIEKADYYINVTYWNKNDLLQCQFSLIEAMSSIKKNVFSIDIEKNTIPNDIAYTLSDNSNEISNFKNTVETGKKDFSLNLWTKKGVSPVFKIGEKLIFFVLSQLDCFLQIYHVNANNDITLLYPNFYQQDNDIKAEKILQIPDVSANFEFLLHQPTGIEFIYVLASTMQFKSIPINKMNSFTLIGTSNDKSINFIKKSTALIDKDALLSEAFLSYVITE